MSNLLPKTCSNCGTQVTSPQAKFCGKCRQALDTNGAFDQASNVNLHNLTLSDIVDPGLELEAQYRKDFKSKRFWFGVWLSLSLLITSALGIFVTAALLARFMPDVAASMLAAALHAALTLGFHCWYCGFVKRSRFEEVFGILLSLATTVLFAYFSAVRAGVLQDEGRDSLFAWLFSGGLFLLESIVPISCGYILAALFLVMARAGDEFHFFSSHAHQLETKPSPIQASQVWFDQIALATNKLKRAENELRSALRAQKKLIETEREKWENRRDVLSKWNPVEAYVPRARNQQTTVLSSPNTSDTVNAPFKGVSARQTSEVQRANGRY